MEDMGMELMNASALPRCLSCGRVMVPDDDLRGLDRRNYAWVGPDQDALPVCDSCDEREVLRATDYVEFVQSTETK